ncbi:MAG: bifunctional glutamate N-acetyltransferase/amino-acid acetyltransferase ArgJ [Candidatus Omnitrophota bacterium]
MKVIKGGVCAPQGFKASSGCCGIKKSKRDDLALLVSSAPCIAAGTFTLNKMRSGSVDLCEDRIKKSSPQAVIVNSGIANACCGKKELVGAQDVSGTAAKKLGLKKEMVLMCSTGVIGKPLPVGKIKKGLGSLVKGLSSKNGTGFSKAIMTTDTVNKEIAIEFEIDGKKVRLGGACKGSGMIYPNMATMLAFFTTDISIEKSALKSAFKESVDYSFNRITVDGDMSTNDTAIMFANSLAGNKCVRKNTKEYLEFKDALTYAAMVLAKKIVLDGEGATRFVRIYVKGAKTEKDASIVARSIANSSLVKTMIAGGDPNWGRVAASIGYSGVDVKKDKVDIYFGKDLVMKNGSETSAPRKRLEKLFKNKEIDIVVDIKMGRHCSWVWSCDLTKRYIEINSEYET